jgi:hypothetical protein
MVWPHDKSLAKLLGLPSLGCLGILDFRIHHKVCFWGGELEPPGTQNNETPCSFDVTSLPKRLHLNLEELPGFQT